MLSEIQNLPDLEEVEIYDEEWTEWIYEGCNSDFIKAGYEWAWLDCPLISFSRSYTLHINPNAQPAGIYTLKLFALRTNSEIEYQVKVYLHQGLIVQDGMGQPINTDPIYLNLDVETEDFTI